MTPLTASEKRTLALLRRRGPATTYTSNRHGESYVPFGSAQSLEKRGLAVLHLDLRSTWSVTLTPAGLKVASELDP